MRVCAGILTAAAALMEYHCGKNVEIASRIFERGLEQFSDEIDLVMRYLGFLISVNDDNSESFTYSWKYTF